MCGTGVGTLVLPPLVELAILHLGWRGAMRALAALCLASVSCGAVMFPAPASEPAPEETQESEGAGAGQQQEVGQGRPVILVGTEGVPGLPRRERRWLGGVEGEETRGRFKKI